VVVGRPVFTSRVDQYPKRLVPEAARKLRKELVIWRERSCRQSGYRDREKETNLKIGKQQRIIVNRFLIYMAKDNTDYREAILELR
jgi:hypothetical protein